MERSRRTYQLGKDYTLPNIMNRISSKEYIMQYRQDLIDMQKLVDRYNFLHRNHITDTTFQNLQSQGILPEGENKDHGF